MADKSPEKRIMFRVFLKIWNWEATRVVSRERGGPFRASAQRAARNGETKRMANSTGGGEFPFFSKTLSMFRTTLRFNLPSGLLGILLSLATLAASADPAALDWPPLTPTSRPCAYWWWMGSAVDTNNIARELQRYHDAGLGGVHIIPIYGAKGWESKYISYLSPQWLDMLDFTVRQAGQLGLTVDMTTGTGWCFGGPEVTDEEANAFLVSRTWSLAGGDKLTATLPRPQTQALMAFNASGSKVDLLPRIPPDGSVNWPAPAGKWTVYALSQKPSGQKVKRPAPGDEGHMLNPFYLPAMTDYLGWIGRALTNYHGAKPRAQYQDSYEYKSDWAPDLLAQFEQRRGYRLQDKLDIFLSGQPVAEAARIKCDYRETISDVMATETIPLWVNWAHQLGYLVRYEAHGTPGNWLDLYADADIPETEMFYLDRDKLVAKFASSAAHVAGKPLASAETGTWLKEHFTGTLADMKYLVDDMFLSGENHLFYHGTCYSPDEAAWPGWQFYASFEMNPRNPIWQDVSALNTYVTRCQSVLQSGQSDNDILLYWPIHDYWSDPRGMVKDITVHAQQWFNAQPISHTAKELWDRGYAFDYVSDAQLQTAQVANGKIQLPGGQYQVIVVPESTFFPLATFKQLLALAHAGATVIFENHLPPDISGDHDWAQQHSEFAALKSTLSFSSLARPSGTIQDAPLGMGHVEISDLLSLPSREPLVAAGLSFTRRSFAGGWTYFIANRGTSHINNWITLGRAAQSAALLDPLTGRSGVAATRLSATNSLEIHLQLAAGESIILRAFAPEKISGPAWTYWQPQTPGVQPQTLSRPWNVKFIQGGPVLPADFQTAQLASWTTFPDTNTTAFAGTASYETTFDAPDLAGKSVELNLGDVRQSARIKLNGQDYGPLITPPFRIVVDNLKPTSNQLQIDVTSVGANRIRDLDRRGVKWQYFRDINYVTINYHPFNAANWPLTDSGLLGPVTLTPVRALP